MSKPFKGIIDVDVRQSVPDWAPYTQPIAPEGSPNVLYVVLDDGVRPWPFAGGTIHKAVIDVSGEPFVDLAREAAAAFARD